MGYITSLHGFQAFRKLTVESHNYTLEVSEDIPLLYLLFIPFIFNYLKFRCSCLRSQIIERYCTWRILYIRF